jgi:hypothetical protein
MLDHAVALADIAVAFVGAARVHSVNLLWETGKPLRASAARS